MPPYMDKDGELMDGGCWMLSADGVQFHQIRLFSSFRLGSLPVI